MPETSRQPSLRQDTSLVDKVALVTGGGSGLGQACAVNLADAGCHVAVLDLKPAAARETAALVEGLGRRALALAADVADYDGVKACIARTVETLGQPLVVISNAGHGSPSSFRKETKENWKRMFEVHVDGAFHCIRETINPMVDAGWGRVVCMSSIVGLRAWRGAASYAAAKGALFSLVRNLSEEVAAKGVTVNAVAPGMIDTPLSLTAPAELRARRIAGIPMRQAGQPADIAHAVRYLCGESGRYVTGQIISPNGGLWFP